MLASLFFRMVRARAVARVLLLVAGLGTAACVSLEQSAPPVATVAGATPGANLSLGREIYITSCAKCHAVEPVRKYRREEWKNHIIPEMAALTKLTPDETQAVHDYVMAVLDTPAR